MKILTEVVGKLIKENMHIDRIRKIVVIIIIIQCILGRTKVILEKTVILMKKAKKIIININLEVELLARSQKMNLFLRSHLLLLIQINLIYFIHIP